jgi:cholesterol transport system auxiliary component
VKTRRDFLILSAAGLAGCGIVPDVNKPVKLYTLKRPEGMARSFNDLPKVNWQLVVAEPVAQRDIDTTRIALTRTPNVIEYFADGSWADTAPNLVQAKLIETFEETNSITAVGRDAAGLKADYVLQSELRDFQAEYAADGVPKAHVSLTAKLVQMPERRIVRTMSRGASTAAAGRDLPSVVAAFQSALDEVTSDIVMDVFSAG